MQDDATEHLDVEVAHRERTLGRFADRGEDLRQMAVQDHLLGRDDLLLAGTLVLGRGDRRQLGLLSEHFLACLDHVRADLAQAVL